MEQKNKRIMTASVFMVLFVFSFLNFGNLIYRAGLQAGEGAGYIKALTDVRDYADMEFEWSTNTDGTYNIKMWKNGGLMSETSASFDLLVQHYRAGELQGADRHAGTLTNLGKDWLEAKISGTQNATQIAKYISVDDTDSSGLSVASIQLTSELDAAGLSRAAGTYTSTGVGAWTVAKTFSVTGTEEAQTYGLQWDSFPMNGNSLLCYDTSALKNLVNGDTLAVTWTCAVS